MLPTKNSSHGVESLALRIEQFKDSPNLQALLISWVSPVQDLEDVLWDIILSRTLAGVGDQLDNLGALVGEARDGRADEFYRPAISVRILTNQSNGSPEELMRIAQAVATIDGVPTELVKDFVQYQEFQPARFRVSSLLSTEGNRALFAAIQRAKPAGVAFDFVGNGSFPEDAITYDHTAAFVPAGLGFAHTSVLPDNVPNNVQSY